MMNAAPESGPPVRCRGVIMTRIVLIAGAVLAGIVQPAVCAAQAIERTGIDIPSQDLFDALRSLAQRTGTEVVVSPAAVRGRRSHPVRGHLSVREALSRMLSGSGLVSRPVPGGGFIIERIAPPPTNRPSVGAARVPAADTDIVVTARKRREHAVDVPVALSATDGGSIEAHGQHSVTEYLRQVPGVGAYAGDGTVHLAIRGITTTLGGNENGYYLDDLPFTGVTVPVVPDVRAWDLDRIEVLRGPQGTLFGEGSIGGTVRILTKDADPSHWDSRESVSFGVTRGGAPSHALRGVVNIPVIDDVLAVRISGTDEYEGGWRDRPTIGITNDNAARYRTIRAKMRFQPTDRLTIDATASHYDASPPGNTLADDDRRLLGADTLRSRIGYSLLGATAQYRFDAAEAFYSYSRMRFDSTSVGNYYAGSLDSGLALRVEAQELRLSSRGKNALQWTFGAYRRNARRQDAYQIAEYGIDALDIATNDAHALFGEATYTIANIGVDFTAGLRLYQERVSGMDVKSIATGTRHVADFTAANPRFGVAWHILPGLTLYTNAARGFRSGQVQPNAVVAVAKAMNIDLPAELPQDSIWSYEAGGKADLADGRLSVEAAAFKSRWRNVAVRIPLGGTGLNGLIPSDGLTITGVEWSLTGRPWKNLTASVSGAYNDSTYIAAVAGTSITAGAPADDFAKFTTSMAVDYAFPISGRITSNSRIVWQHSSPRVFEAVPGARPGDAIDQLDLRLGIAYSGLSLAIFADNVLDDGGAVSYRSPDLNVLSGVSLVANRLRPRTIGIELTRGGRGR